MPTAVATAVLIVAILFFFVFCVGNRHGAVYLSFFDFPEFGPLIVCLKNCRHALPVFLSHVPRWVISHICTYVYIFFSSLS